ISCATPAAICPIDASLCERTSASWLRARSAVILLKLPASAANSSPSGRSIRLCRSPAPTRSVPARSAAMGRGIGRMSRGPTMADDDGEAEADEGHEPRLRAQGLGTGQRGGAARFEDVAELVDPLHRVARDALHALVERQQRGPIAARERLLDLAPELLVAR